MANNMSVGSIFVFAEKIGSKNAIAWLRRLGQTDVHVESKSLNVRRPIALPTFEMVGLSVKSIGCAIKNLQYRKRNWRCAML